MQQLASRVSIAIPNSIYLKDPESSELGRRILRGSIELISEIGLEAFTFGKLARRIDSSEASVYRYFENKHRLLLYLVTWYWGWMEYRMVFALANVDSAEDRLRRAIQLLTEPVREDGSFEHIDEVKLNRIVVAESAKAYLTQDVDVVNERGAYRYYKQLVDRVAKLVLEINPDYPYPHMLISTIAEGTHLQRFFGDHLPRLTNIREGEDSVVCFYTQMAFQTINSK